MRDDEDEGEAWWRISRAVAKAMAWCLVGRAERERTVINDDNNQFRQRAGRTTRDEMRWLGGGTVVPALLTTVHQPY